jgi:Spy/CpxP family protein refolding chaperone
MKKILLLTMMGLGVLSIQAQDSTRQKSSDRKVQLHERKARKSGKMQRQPGMHRMDSVLQLTEAQKIKLKELNEEYQQKRMAVYTPEQKAKLEQFQKNRQQRMKQGKHPKGPMVSNLTEEQKSSMRTMREKQREEAALIKANTALSDAEKKTKLKALHEANRENMRQILTPEQMEQLKKRSKSPMDGPAR